MGGGDRRGGGRTNGFSPDGNIPGMPGGQQPQGGFDGMVPPNMPNGQQPQGGFDGSTPPDMPGGQQPQDGFGNQGQIGNASSDANTITFTMTYKVNGFSGVADYNGGTTAPGNASQPQLPGTASGNFTDVNSGASYADAVAWAVAQGVTNGTGDGTTFSPADTVTRAEAMTFLWRAAGSPAPQNTSDRFTDVPTNEYYSDAVAWAVENGITEGTGDGTTFSPDAPVTNAQMLAFLARAMGAETTGSDWQQAAMDWAGENGLTEGLPGTIDAAADCPRSDVVFFLWRIYGDK